MESFSQSLVPSGGEREREGPCQWAILVVEDDVLQIGRLHGILNGQERGREAKGRGKTFPCLWSSTALASHGKRCASPQMLKECSKHLVGESALYFYPVFPGPSDHHLAILVAAVSSYPQSLFTSP